MKKLSKLLLFAILIFLVSQGADFCTKGFRISRILFNLEEKEIPPPPDSILTQRFSYLGSGRHFFAFLSEDGKYVCKFFKNHRISPEIKQQIMCSIELGFNKIQKETALIYIHLGKTNNLKTKLQIVDPLGICHNINADTTPFIIQKKAELTQDLIRNLLEQGRQEEAEKSLQALLVHIKKRCEKGVKNTDLAFCRNWGFIEGTPVELDLGDFHELAPSQIEARWKKESIRCKRWVKKYFPTLLPFIESNTDPN